MSAGLPSDEVADDYKNSLEDLVTNDRYQIGNLTVIAKENIEHGEAIARVLENHIQRVGISSFGGVSASLITFGCLERHDNGGHNSFPIPCLLRTLSYLLTFDRHLHRESFQHSTCSIQSSKMSELHTLFTLGETCTTPS